MAETWTLKDNTGEKEAEIYGFPVDQGEAAAVKLYDEIYQIDPTFKGTYQEALALQMSQNPGAQVPTPGGGGSLDDIAPLPGSQPTDQPGGLDDVAPMGGPQEADQEQGQTTLKGILDSVIRGAGDEAAAMTLGALLGSALPGVGTVAGAGAGLLAKSGSEAVLGLVDLGRNIVANLTGFEGDIEGMTPQQMWTTIFDAAGFERPDTKTEEMFQRVGEVAGETATMLSGGRALQAGGVGPGGVPVANPSTAARTGQVISQAPGAQIVGGMTGEVSGEQTAQLAERFGGGPGVQTAARLLGGVAGDALGSGFLGTPGVRAMNKASNRMDAAGMTVPRARNAIQAGRDAGVPVYRTDIMPPDTPRAQIRQDVREGILGGMGGPRTRQQLARRQAIVNELSEFDVHVGDPSLTLTDDLMESFVEPRQTALNKYTTERATARASVPPEAPVNTQNTIDYIDNKIEELLQTGAVDTNVNTAGNVDPQDVAQSNLYGPTIQKLQRWRAALQGKTLPQIENLRAKFRQDFSMDRPQGVPFKTEEDQIINAVYSTLRDDIGGTIREYGGEEMYQLWDEANINLANLAGDFNDDVLKRLVRSTKESVPIDEAVAESVRMEEMGGQETMVVQSRPELIRRMVTSEDASVVERVFERLSPEGKEQAAAAFLEDAVNKATPNIRDLSPNEFANVMHDELARRGVVLSAEGNEKLQGLEELLDVTRRAQMVSRASPADPTQAVGSVPGGRYNMARALAANPIVGALTAGISLGSGAVLARIYDSPRVRDELLELVAGTADPQKMQRLALSIFREIGRQMNGEEAAEEPVAERPVSAESAMPASGGPVSAERRVPTIQTRTPPPTRTVPTTLRGRPEESR